MADITKLIQVLTVNHKEQMKEKARRHQEQMKEQDRCHKEQIDEQARQSREQEKKNVEQMAVLIDQVKVRDAEMKHLIEAADDGAKGSSTPWPVSSHLIQARSCGWITWKNSGLSSQQTSFPKKRKLSVSDQPDYSNLQVT